MIIPKRGATMRVFIGCGLCLFLLAACSQEHSDVTAAYQAMISACEKHGKYPGMGGIYEPALLQKYVGMGVKLVLAGSDLSLLLSAGKTRVADVREAK